MVRILVVDDEQNVRATLRAMLEHAGHTVDEAADGKECLAQIRKELPDIVIMDIQMPEQEGIGTILEIRRIHAQLPVIAVSGTGHAELDLASAKGLGANMSLMKPVRKAVLLAAIEKCLTKGKPH